MSSATTRFLLLLIAATATSTGALRRHSKANSSKFDVKQASQSANGTSSCTYVNTKGRTLVINGMIMMECSGYDNGGDYYFEKDGFFWYEGDRVAKISGSGCDASFDWRGEAWQKAGCWVRRYPVMNEGNTVATYTGVEETDCQSRCFQNPSCSSFSYTPSDGPKSICKLKDQTVKAEDPSTPKYLRHRTYFQVARPGSSWQGTAPSPPSFDIPPACDEKLSEPKGADYRGCQNRGSKSIWYRPCAGWDSSDYWNAANFPDAGLEKNFCRNPDNSSKPWCLLEGSSAGWAYCLPKQDMYVAEGQNCAGTCPGWLGDRWMFYDTTDPQECAQLCRYHDGQDGYPENSTRFCRSFKIATGKVEQSYIVKGRRCELCFGERFESGNCQKPTDTSQGYTNNVYNFVNIWDMGAEVQAPYTNDDGIVEWRWATVVAYLGDAEYKVKWTCQGCAQDQTRHKSTALLGKGIWSKPGR